MRGQREPQLEQQRPGQVMPVGVALKRQPFADEAREDPVGGASSRRQRSAKSESRQPKRGRVASSRRSVDERSIDCVPRRGEGDETGMGL
jgi:hypothetical protein